jgi:ABC-2 type transport system permease protein
LQVLTGAFWYSIWLYLLTIMVSMGLTILMAVAMSAIGRSMSVGLTLAMVWFPADNIAVLVIFIIGTLVHNPNLFHISEYLLGPNLNQMPVAIVPSNPYNVNITPGPQITVDGTHTLLIALGYAVIFAAIAIILTWKRDIKE